MHMLPSFAFGADLMDGLQIYHYDPREFLGNDLCFCFADLGSVMNLDHNVLVWEAEGDEWVFGTVLYYTDILLRLMMCSWPWWGHSQTGPAFLSLGLKQVVELLEGLLWLLWHYGILADIMADFSCYTEK